MLVKCAYFHEFLGLTKFSSYFNQKYGWLLHKVREGGHLPHPGSAIEAGGYLRCLSLGLITKIDRLHNMYIISRHSNASG